MIFRQAARSWQRTCSCKISSS